MYLAMIRFKVNAGQQAAFETIWTVRESQLPQVPGFVSFHLLKGPVADGIRLYASHTMWKDEKSFEDWALSKAFRSAHSGAGGHQGVMAGHPKLVVFESVQHIAA